MPEGELQERSNSLLVSTPVTHDVSHTVDTTLLVTLEGHLVTQDGVTRLYPQCVCISSVLMVIYVSILTQKIVTYSILG